MSRPGSEQFEGFDNVERCARRNKEGKRCRGKALSDPGAKYCELHTCKQPGCLLEKGKTETYCPKHTPQQAQEEETFDGFDRTSFSDKPRIKGRASASQSKVSPAPGTNSNSNAPPALPPARKPSKTISGTSSGTSNTEPKKKKSTSSSSSISNTHSLAAVNNNSESNNSESNKAAEAENDYVTAEELVKMIQKKLQDDLYESNPEYRALKDNGVKEEPIYQDINFEAEMETANESRDKYEEPVNEEERDAIGCREGVKRSPNSKCAVLTIGMFLVLILWLAGEPFLSGNLGAFIGIIVAIYLFYLIECMNGKTCKYLRNVMTREESGEHYTMICKESPIITWHIQCYHMETRQRWVSDGNGGGHYETYTVRVNTHSAHQVHKINLWMNASHPFGDSRQKMTKLKYKKHFIWMDDVSKAMHDIDFRQWITFHDRDVYKDVSWNWYIPGWKKSVFEVEDGEQAPWWVRKGLGLYIFLVLIGLSWPYRAAMAAITTKRKEHIRKVVGWIGQSWN